MYFWQETFFICSQVILRKWCGKILRSSALPKLSHQNRVKLLLWQITNRLVTGLDSTKTMCPHRCKATKIFPFYTCMCIDFLWKKTNKREPFLSKLRKWLSSVKVNNGHAKMETINTSNFSFGMKGCVIL